MGGLGRGTFQSNDENANPIKQSSIYLTLRRRPGGREKIALKEVLNKLFN
jgi:hypothetical protein